MTLLMMLKSGPWMLAHDETKGATLHYPRGWGGWTRRGDRHPIGAMRIPRAKTTLGDLSARRLGLIARSVSTSPLACVSFIGVTSCTLS
jgi:hypothetical protein